MKMSQKCVAEKQGLTESLENKKSLLAEAKSSQLLLSIAKIDLIAIPASLI
jgi:hypothetical protein